MTAHASFISQLRNLAPLLAGLTAVGMTQGLAIAGPRMLGAFRSYDAVGADPIVSCDLNRDGISDVVVAGSFSTTHTLTTYLGLGDGTLGGRIDYTLGDPPKSIAVGDFNLDMVADIVVGSYSSTSVSLFLGNPDGTLGPQVDVPIAHAPDANMIIGDLNNDGYPDVIAGTSTGRHLLVLQGHGDGTFDEARLVFSGLLPLSIDVGDLDLDGNLDVVAGSNSDSVAVLMGDGSGSFTLGEVLLAGLGSTELTLADLNHDGNLDITCVNLQWTGYTTFMGLGNGSFGPRDTDPFGSRVYRGIGIADLNGDTHPDRVLLTADYLAISYGNGLGGRLPTIEDHTVGRGPSHLAFGDFNRDGLVDAVAATARSISVVLNNGTPSFAYRRESPLTNSHIGMAAGDFNEDGHMDVVVGRAPVTSNGMLALGRGDGTFGPTFGLSTDSAPEQILAADLDGDHHLDIAVANRGSGTSTILKGLGNGSFGPKIRYLCADGPNSICAGRLNADTLLDIVVGNSSSRDVAVFINIGGGTFGAATRYALPYQVKGLAIADIDGDGVLDIVAGQSNQLSVGLFHGLGDGTFSPGTIVPVSVGVEDLVVAHLDADSLLDIAVAGGSSDPVSVIRGLGGGAFGPPLSLPSARRAIGIRAVDLSDDGTLDIVTVNEEPNSVSVFSVLDDGQFAPRRDYGVGSWPMGLAIADFDEDGKPDIAASNTRSQTVAVVLNRNLMLSTSVGSGQGRIERLPDRRFYDPGTSVTVTAVPDPSWSFDQWEGLLGASNPLNVLLEADTSLAASFVPIPVAVGGQLPAPKGLSLVSPNPARASVDIQFQIDVPGVVRVSIVDLQGRLVEELERGTLAAGTHERHWDGRKGRRAVAPGVYFIRLETARRTWVRRLAVVR